MTITEMLGQSGMLSVLGMGIVFGFLIIMIIAITVVGKVIQSMTKNQPAVTSAGAAPVASSAGTASGNNAPVTAAISAAVNEYRKSK